MVFNPAGFRKAEEQSMTNLESKAPVNLPAAKGESAGVAEALAFGLTDDMLAAFPELRNVYNLFVAEQYTKAREAYYNTNYFRNLTATSQQRRAKKATQPGVYTQEFDAWKQEQRVRLASKGITFTPSIEAMLEDSYLRGDSERQVDLRVLNSGEFGNIGGSTLGLVNSLKMIAADQGVNNLLDKNYWQKVSSGLFAGTMTEQDVQEQIKNFAVSAYPAYAKGIEEGRSFSMQTSAVRQLLANELEKDVDSITNDNPLFQKVTGYMNPKTQAPEQMPLWMARKLARSTEEWLYTDNARASLDNLAMKVLRDMGVA